MPMMLTLFTLSLQFELNETIKQLGELVKGQKYAEVLSLSNQALAEDPTQVRYAFFRAQAEEHAHQYESALRDYASVVKTPNPYKFKSIMKLKGLCVGVCQFKCEEQFSQQVLGKEMYQQLQNLTLWRNQALSGDNLTELAQLSQKCNLDPQIYLRIADLYIQQSNFAEAAIQLRNLQNLVSDPVQLENVVQIIDILGKFSIFHFDGASQFSDYAFLSDELRNDLQGYFESMHPCFLVTEKSSILLHPLDVESYQKCANNANQSTNVYRPLLEKLGALAQDQLQQSQLNLHIDLTELLAQMNKYHSAVAALAMLSADHLSKTPLSDHDYMNAFDAILDSDSLTLSAMKSVAEYVYILSEEVPPLQRELNDAREVDAEINMLEAKIEQARKRLNRAKFFKSEEQLENVIWLIQDCNQVFDQVFLLRKAYLQPDFFKLLNITQNATNSEIKKAYHKIALGLHPDQYPADISPEEKKKRQRMFQRAAEAYDTLVSQQKRSRYLSGQYNAEEINQRYSIHNQRKQAAFDVPPNYVAGKDTISDEEIKKRLTEEQWYEYQKSRRSQ